MDWKEHPTLRLVGSTVVTIVLLLLFAVAIAAATFVEARAGTARAWQVVYDALWFEGLLALLVVNLVAALLIRMPFRAAQTGLVITHVAFIIVLLGAGATRYFGFEGIVHIREGSSADFMYSDSDYVRLSSGGATVAVPARFARSGEVALRRELELNGTDYRLTVADYWPHFERRIVDRPGGSPAVQMVLAAAQGRELHTLWRGETVHAEGVAVRFLEHAPSDHEVGVAPGLGELTYVLAGHPFALAVPEDLPAEVERDGYAIRIIEFTPDFKVGGVGAHAEELRNPAIRVALRAPDGTEDERLLFAFHPEFRSPKDDPAFDRLQLSYRIGARIDLYAVDGGLEGVANVHLVAASQGSESVDRSITSGETFAFEQGVAIGSGAFAMQLAHYWSSAVEVAGPSQDESQPSALQVVIEDASGQRAEVVVPRGDAPSAARVGEQELSVEFGPRRIQLPYTLHLDDFLLVNYPGSENPASYESHVRLSDAERGIHDRPVRIYMNHPLTYRGYKHFQSSYDTDRRGTVLSVNYDPGKWPTYLGYTLLGLGFLITLTRGILWMRAPQQRSAR